MSETRRIALIREAECIGCTKCIQACPVDAIIGAAQLMHTVIADHCIGCDLCVPPCPVDCIDMIELPQTASAAQQREDAKLAKQRAAARKRRLARLEAEAKAERQKRLAEIKQSPEAQARIRAAMEKATKARSGRSDEARKQEGLERIKARLHKMKEELKAAKKQGDNTEELERRIKTWEQKLTDH